MSARERTKGAVAEREVIALLHAHGWPHAERSSNGRAQKTRGDVIAGPAGVHIEIKRHERLNVPNAFDQVMDDAKAFDIPVLVHRPSRHEWMATTPLVEILVLLKLREMG